MNHKEKVDFTYFTRVTGNNSFLKDGEQIEDKRIKFYMSTTGSVIERVTEKVKTRLSTQSHVTIAMDDDKIDLSNVNYDFYIQQVYKVIDKINQEK